MLTQKDIKRINRARKTLKDIQSRCAHSRRREEYPYDYSFGIASEAADQAENALFHLLNLVNAHQITKVSDADLHMREGVEV